MMGGPPAVSAPPTLRALFLSYLRISLLGVGGGTTSWIWHEVVVKRRWIDERKFVGGVSLSQIIPGANAVNLAVFVGASLRGAPGAISAFAGLIFLPAIILLTLGTFYVSMRQIPVFQSVLAGMSAAAIGLNFAVGVRLLRIEEFEWRQIVTIAAVVGFIGLLRMPLLPVLAVVGLIGLALVLLGDRSRRK
jgi:chromate transporter